MKRYQTITIVVVSALYLVVSNPAAAANIVENPGFESGTDGWFGMGCSIAATSAVYHGGARI